MNEMINVFENEEFGNVRVIKEDDKLLFCGSDVAKALATSDLMKQFQLIVGVR